MADETAATLPSVRIQDQDHFLLSNIPLPSTLRTRRKTQRPIRNFPTFHTVDDDMFDPLGRRQKRGGEVGRKKTKDEDFSMLSADTKFYVDHMHRMLLENDRKKSPFPSRTKAETPEPGTNPYEDPVITQQKIKQMEIEEQEKKEKRLKERQLQKVRKDFKQYIEPINKHIGKVDPSKSVFEIFQYRLKKKPELLLSERRQLQNQLERENKQMAKDMENFKNLEFGGSHKNLLEEEPANQDDKIYTYQFKPDKDKFRGANKNIYVRLQNQDQRCKKKLFTVIDNSNQALMKLKQGKTLYKTMEDESKTSGQSIMPEVVEPGEQEAKKLNIPILNDPYLVTKVREYLDHSSMQAQMVEKDSSIFNDLLRQQNWNKQKIKLRIQNALRNLFIRKVKGFNRAQSELQLKKQAESKRKPKEPVTKKDVQNLYRMCLKHPENPDFGRNPALLNEKPQRNSANQSKSMASFSTMKPDTSADHNTLSAGVLEREGNLTNLKAYLGHCGLQVNVEQKLYHKINMEQKASTNFHSHIDAILPGYMDRDLHDALVYYLTEFKINKMTQEEVDLILSKVFAKSRETRAFQHYIKKLWEKKRILVGQEPAQQQGTKPAAGPGAAPGWKVPNLLKAADINFDQFTGHLNYDKILEVFKKYVQLKQKSLNHQKFSFQILKNVLFKIERFNSILMDPSKVPINSAQDIDESIEQFSEQLASDFELSKAETEKHLENFRARFGRVKSALPTRDKDFFQKRLKDQSIFVPASKAKKPQGDRPSPITKQKGEEASHESILKQISHFVKERLVDEFEEIFNHQMYAAQNPKLANVKNVGQTQFISGQSKKKLRAEFEFRPGEEILCDAAIISTYVTQLDLFDTVKAEHSKKAALHSVMNDARDSAMEKQHRLTNDNLALVKEKEMQLRMDQQNEDEIRLFHKAKDVRLKSQQTRDVQLLQQFRAFHRVVANKNYLLNLRNNRQLMPLEKQLKSMGGTKAENDGLGVEERLMHRETEKRANYLFKILRTKSLVLESKDELNASILRILERMDLDRPILFQEKIDVLLGDKDAFGADPEPVTTVANQSMTSFEPLKTMKSGRIDQTAKVAIAMTQSEISNKKLQRKKLNTQQRQIYNGLLLQLARRLKIQNEKTQDSKKTNFEREDFFTGVTIEEIKFLNLLKLILDAGWCFDASGLQDVLRISGIDEKLEYGIKLLNLQHELRQQEIEAKRNRDIQRVNKKFQQESLVPEESLEDVQGQLTPRRKKTLKEIMNMYRLAQYFVSRAGFLKEEL